jgi:hypothetical protein
MRFYAQISPYAGILATRGLGPSRDRILTGKMMRASGHAGYPKTPSPQGNGVIYSHVSLFGMVGPEGLEPPTDRL